MRTQLMIERQRIVRNAENFVGLQSWISLGLKTVTWHRNVEALGPEILRRNYHANSPSDSSKYVSVAATSPTSRRSVLDVFMVPAHVSVLRIRQKPVVFGEA